MKKIFLVFVLVASSASMLCAQPTWNIVGGKITTPWAEKVNPASVLPEYPRPQMIRSNWINLNGLWQYSILPKAQDDKPASYQGSILVPFAVESALSGVGKTVGKDSILWYNRTVTLPAKFKNQTVLMHFGAVDWRCEVFINGKNVGVHEGGFDPFSFDITSALKKSRLQEISIRIWDPTDQGPQPRGKQVRRPNGIWYTPVTGIWQTVWMEAVPKTYIVSTKQTPDLDNQSLKVSAQIQNVQPNDVLKVSAWDGSRKVAEQTLLPDGEVTINIPDPKIWSTESPFLYDLKLSIERAGKTLDEVQTYFAMRKISIGQDKNGIQRMLLNNKFVFQYGPLDQGWWPDGLYTAPTDEALKFDVEQTKAMGFNMIRKHIKVEPARWYNYCDKLGIVVWQDMPSGDLGNRWDSRPFIVGLATEQKRSQESENYYRKDWNAIIDALYNFPSIVCWIPFNEAWGQFKTEEIVNWTMKKDPSRLVNAASGGNYFPVGHIVDLHNYPEPAMPSPDIFGSKYAIVLGEFGGLGLPVQGHTWQERNWGYQRFGTADSLLMRYTTFTNSLEDLIRRGLSAAVYTQTTDVESETNGMLTYDRKVFKIPADKLRQLHMKFYNPALVTLQ